MEDDIYLSDQEEVYWSDEEVDDSNEDFYSMRPKCIGCQCSRKRCNEIMPLDGSVEIIDLSFGPKEKELHEYYWLLKEGVKIDFQCAKCTFCKECENSVGLNFNRISDGETTVKQEYQDSEQKK